MLLKEIESEAKNSGAIKIFTHTNKEDDKVIAFNIKYGYELTGSVSNYYYDGSATFLVKLL